MCLMCMRTVFQDLWSWSGLGNNPSCRTPLVNVCQLGHVKKKKCLQTCIKCADSHHPDHVQSLIWAFWSPWKHCIVSSDSVYRQQRPWSDCTSMQSDQGLCCLHMTQRYILMGLIWCITVTSSAEIPVILTLVMLNKLRCHTILIFSQSNYLIQIVDMNSYT